MEYLLLFITLFLYTSRCAGTTEKYINYKNSNPEIKNEEYGKAINPHISGSYQVTEDVDDIPDYRPKPGPVVVDYNIQKPLNHAKVTNKTESSGNSESKKKHKHNNGKTRKYGQSSNIFFEEDLADDDDVEIQAGFYNSIKEVVSDFKNSLWNSFNSLFSKSHSI